jgi:hypothetical protein
LAAILADVIDTRINPEIEGEVNWPRADLQQRGPLSLPSSPRRA